MKVGQQTFNIQSNNSVQTVACSISLFFEKQTAVIKEMLFEVPCAEILISFPLINNYSKKLAWPRIFS